MRPYILSKNQWLRVSYLLLMTIWFIGHPSFANGSSSPVNGDLKVAKAMTLDQIDNMTPSIDSLNSSNQDLKIRVEDLTNAIPSITSAEDSLKRIGDTLESWKDGPARTAKQEYPFGPRDWLLALSILFALYTFTFTSIRQLQYKRVDTMLEFTKRYYELLESEPIDLSDEGKPQTKKDTLKFERQHFLFWSLQHQQFSTWRRGLIPHTTYQYWMARRIMENGNEDALGYLNWDVHKKRFAETDFFQFMKQLFDVPEKLKNNQNEQVKQKMAMAHAKTTLWNHLHYIFKLRFLFIKEAFPHGLFSYFTKN